MVWPTHRRQESPSLGDLQLPILSISGRAVHLCFGTDAMQAGFLPTQPTTSILPCIPSADNTRFSVGGWVFNQGDVTLSAHGIK